MRRMFGALVVAAICGAVFAPDAGRAQGTDTVKVGVNKVISDIVFYIAEERGFFAEQKLKVELISFDSGPRMIAPLGVGQIDIGAGASSAGIFQTQIVKEISIWCWHVSGRTPLVVNSESISLRLMEIFRLKMFGRGRAGIRRAR